MTETTTERAELWEKLRWYYARIKGLEAEYDLAGRKDEYDRQERLGDELAELKIELFDLQAECFDPSEDAKGPSFGCIQPPDQPPDDMPPEWAGEFWRWQQVMLQDYKAWLEEQE